MKPTRGVTRRRFLSTFSQRALAGAVAAYAGRQVRAGAVSANDRIRLALIGCGGMGSRHLEALLENPQCDVVAACDVWKRRYEAAVHKTAQVAGKAIDGYQDYRYILDRKDVDAVFVVTPDHWHPLLTIHGCEAGKDVYVEKPVCTTIVEGRAMVTAARRYGRVVQAGTQQRSMPVFQKAIEVVRSGRLGPITSATAWVGVNGHGVGETPMPAPDDLDWDLWLGPAPKVPYSPQRHTGFMGWHDYCRGGELTNWGVHLMDVVHWGIDRDRPLNVQAIGGSYRDRPGADNYETIEAIFEYRGCTVTWEQRHTNFYANKGYGIKFQGPLGQLAVDRGTFAVIPKSLGIPEFIGEPERSWANPDHHNNFFECIRTRKRPVADIEQGFRSTTAPLLAGIALKTRRKLNWDGDAERFVHDESANRHLSRAYRAPWHL
ncbi:MAG TPA: Gfo/Idh/MocA family oxidoreductase [Candidatus Hydrogenedentes bacterium]|nr:Gfo/Idh/MocA family oxidoreductase [Candidatus Hydrogenedentota bacterium]